MKRSCIVVIVLGFAAAVSAQTVTTAPATRDANAIAVLQAAVTALGGASAINAIQDCTATGSIAVSTPGGNVNGTVTWEWADGQFNYTTILPNQTITVVSGHGKPAQVINGLVTPLYVHSSDAMVPFYLASEVLLQAVNSANYSVQLAGAGIAAGGTVTKVRISYAPDPITAQVTQQTWWLDNATAFPVHVDFNVPAVNNAADLSTAGVDFANFQNFSGVFTPTQLSFSVSGQPLMVSQISSVVFNTGLAPSVFDAPTGGVQ